MNENKIINFGVGLLNKDCQKVTHCVTSIRVDSFSHIATFVIEKGLDVDIVNIDVEEAESLGIINLQKLLPTLINKK